MPTNTQYNPKRTSEFSKDDIQFSGQTIYLDCAVSTESYADLLLTDDYLITGGRLLVENGTIDDKVYLQIVHPVYGVVNEFVSGYRISKDTILQMDLDLPYPAKLSAGLSIRCKYVAAASGVARKIALNLSLHKVLN